MKADKGHEAELHSSYLPGTWSAETISRVNLAGLEAERDALKVRNQELVEALRELGESI